MNTLLAILTTFNSAVPIWAVAMLVILIFIVIDMRYIRRDLSNHITETNKKIEKLDKKIEDTKKELQSDIKEIRQDIKELLKRK